MARFYGYRKIYDDLIDIGEAVSENRVARLARLARIQAQIGDKKTRGVHGGKPSVVVGNTVDPEDCRCLGNESAIRKVGSGFLAKFRDISQS